MKVRTNLPPHDLERIAKGLKRLAEKDAKKYIPENKAEEDLMGEVEAAFKFALQNLKEEIAAGEE